jgi:hypothetical protein
VPAGLGGGGKARPSSLSRSFGVPLTSVAIGYRPKGYAGPPGTHRSPARAGSDGTVKFPPASPRRMVFLFKRRRKGKKDEEAGGSTKPSPAVEKPVPPASAPPAEPVTSAPEPPPAAPPPPLPTATSPATPVTPVAPTAECFLCGTPLVDHHCPKCDMTWVE